MLPEDFALLRRVRESVLKAGWVHSYNRNGRFHLWAHPVGAHVEVGVDRLEDGSREMQLVAETGRRRVFMAWPRSVAEAVALLTAARSIEAVTDAPS